MELHLSSPTSYRYAFDRRRFVRDFNEAFYARKASAARKIALEHELELARKRRGVVRAVAAEAERQNDPSRAERLAPWLKAGEKRRELVEAIAERIMSGEHLILEDQRLVVPVFAGTEHSADKVADDGFLSVETRRQVVHVTFGSPGLLLDIVKPVPMLLDGPFKVADLEINFVHIHLSSPVSGDTDRSTRSGGEETRSGVRTGAGEVQP